MNKKKQLATFGIGANIGNARENIEKAISALAKLGALIARSKLYMTKPWGELNQPDFYNAAAIIEIDLNPHDLLLAVKNIEKQLGRTATYHWGPREIDIDILTFGDYVINDPDLTIPHPYYLQRSFVLVPLAEIDNNYLDALATLPLAEVQEIKDLNS